MPGLIIHTKISNGKMTKERTQTLTLNRNHPQCPAWRWRQPLLSQELQCHSPGTDHKAHWFFHVAHKLEKSRAIVSSCVENRGGIFFPSRRNLWAFSVSHLRGIPLRASSCREQDGSHSAAYLRPTLAAGSTSQSTERAPQSPCIYLITRSPCLHVKTLT